MCKEDDVHDIPSRNNLGGCGRLARRLDVFIISFVFLFLEKAFHLH